jgi:hypothetical protein
MKIRQGVVLAMEVTMAAIATASVALAVGCVLQKGGQKASEIGLEVFGEGADWLGKIVSDGGKGILGAGYATVYLFPKWVYNEGFEKGVNITQNYINSGRAAEDVKFISGKMQTYSEEAVRLGQTQVLTPLEKALIDSRLDQKLSAFYKDTAQRVTEMIVNA